MKTNLPLISVIVPNYNHEKYLVQRLESILNQTYSNFEIILLDDCSTDNSRSILSGYAKHSKVSHCVFNEVNSGNTFIQWNKGINLAKGKYIWIAESDDFSEHTFLEELVLFFDKDKKLTLVYCQSNRVNSEGYITGSWIDYTKQFSQNIFYSNFVMEGCLFIEKFLIYKNVIPNASGVLFLKERAFQLYPLDTDNEMRYCGDWLFYIKLITNSKIGFVSKSLNNFRYHPSSVIAQSQKKSNRVELINIIKLMRRKVDVFFLSETPENVSAISKISKKIVREHEYEKVMYFIRNDNKIKGFLMLTLYVDLFLKNYKFKKNFLLKWNRYCK